MKPIHLLLVLALPTISYAQPDGYGMDFKPLRGANADSQTRQEALLEQLRRQYRSRDHRVEPFVPSLSAAQVCDREVLAGGDACGGRDVLPGSRCRHRIPASPEGICPICREPKPVPSASHSVT
jgi:hypothetical protein